VSSLPSRASVRKSTPLKRAAPCATLSPVAQSESRDAILTKTPAETAALGARVASRLSVGDVLFLHGPLGAGKTTFARGLIGAWTGSTEDVPSPTYTLVQTYEGPRGQLWHVDLYRLDDADAALELGLEDAFASAVTLIEWPERLGPHAPRDRIDIFLQPRGEIRLIEFVGAGGRKGAHFLD